MLVRTEVSEETTNYQVSSQEIEKTRASGKNKESQNSLLKSSPFQKIRSTIFQEDLKSPEFGISFKITAESNLNNHRLRF